MTDAEIASHVDQVRTVGYTVLKGAVAPSVIQEIATAFWPLYETHLETIRDSPNRGPMRHYFVLPFAPPFYQPTVQGHSDVLAIVRALLGLDVYCAQFASDTPAKGSVYQDWHSDVGPLFPDYDEHLLPPSLIAVNLPLVDVGADNGPFEVVDGSHLLPNGLERVRAGELPHRTLHMQIGDVMIRDPRCIHRGSPNTTDQPRPMIVLGFDRGNHRRPGHLFGNAMTNALYDSLSDMEKSAYRVVPRTDG